MEKNNGEDSKKSDPQTICTRCAYTTGWDPMIAMETAQTVCTNLGDKTGGSPKHSLPPAISSNSQACRDSLPTSLLAAVPNTFPQTLLVLPSADETSHCKCPDAF